ncbi:hypothetical protein [Streptomyces sp. NPDC002573]
MQWHAPTRKVLAEQRVVLHTGAADYTLLTGRYADPCARRSRTC